MSYTIEGFLESYRSEGSDLELRFCTGDLDPKADNNQILLVTVMNVEKMMDLCDTFEMIHSQGDDCYIESVSDSEIHVYTTRDDPTVVRGSNIDIRREGYGPRDFERLARLNHQWGESQYRALRHALSKTNEIEKLIRDQHQRIQIKLQGHEDGSTARTLYEQHCRFLERLLETIKA